MTEEEKKLLKRFKVEELEERLEMGSWTVGAEASGGCTGGDCNGTATISASYTF
jgi:hypothetical protein